MILLNKAKSYWSCETVHRLAIEKCHQRKKSLYMIIAVVKI